MSETILTTTSQELVTLHQQQRCAGVLAELIAILGSKMCISGGNVWRWSAMDDIRNVIMSNCSSLQVSIQLIHRQAEYP